MDTARCFQYAEFKGIYGVHIRIHGDWVGGGIYTHGLPFLHVMSETVVGTVSSVAVAGPALAVVGAPLFDGIVGIVVGSLLVGLFMLGKLVLGRKSHLG